MAKRKNADTTVPPITGTVWRRWPRQVQEAATGQESYISSRIRKPDQIIQPWMFGHEATKTTCLWLKGLPPLVPTQIVGKGSRHVTKSGKSLPTWYNLPPSPDRWKIRSATFPGIAEAMATQWSTP
jgi:hypothetical protein